MTIIEEKDYLEHYGILRRSGRYPWGSGGPEKLPADYNKRNKIFVDYINELKKQGLSEKDIAQGMDATINEVRNAKAIAISQERQSNIAMAQRLKDKGYSPTAIGKRMGGVGESTVRSWLEPGAMDRAKLLQSTANMLMETVNEHGLTDVSKGVEHFVGVTRTKFDNAVAMTRELGYELHIVPNPQLSAGHQTQTKVLCPPGMTQKEAFLNRHDIHSIARFSDDGGRTFNNGFHEPIAINSNRIAVKYKEDGGGQADGMLFIRPGKEDLSLGGAAYAQVRVAVGKDHFLKGMAVYKDGLPPGVDIEFHTSKKRVPNKLDAMKKNSEEKGYIPGGEHVILKSVKRQILADPGTSKERVTSALNVVNEEGDWSKWSRNFSSQMLSKQSRALAKPQLDMTFENRMNNYHAINNLTNPTVRKKLLTDFADATDSAAVHLHAAALPRTGPHVILPLSKIRETEVYAPQFRHGETVALVRHPHAGPFEIPLLTVNNRISEGRQIIGHDARDAIGIHHNVASWLSGADFDGDAVLVIPDPGGRIKTSRPLDQLKNFDPRASYQAYPGMKPIKNMQAEMGKISNLITDMSLQGASNDHIARAVRHSMVVIDSEKHNLNHKLSYNDNGIKELTKKYQTGGASTIISRARAEVRVPEFKLRPAKEGGPIDLTTGARVFVPTGKRRKDTGELVKTKVERLAIEPNARALMSSATGHPMERLYADHSNKLKALANRARLDAVKTPPAKQSASAKKAYANQVQSLNDSLVRAQKNAPLERQAQRIANVNYKARVDANPNMDDDTKRKIKYQIETQARIRTGAQKFRIVIHPDEWEAIQAGAISDSKLQEILKHSNMDKVRELALPKTSVLMTPTKTSAAKTMLAAGYTRAQVADHFGVSISTIDEATG